MCLPSHLFLVPRPLRLRWTVGFGYENALIDENDFQSLLPSHKDTKWHLNGNVSESAVQRKAVFIALILNLISL